jgi:hypothetical protein
MLWFFAGVAALILVLLIGKWFSKANPVTLATNLRRIGGVALLAFGAFMGIRGVIPLAGLAAIGGWMLLTGRPLSLFGGPFRGMAGGARSSGQTSTVDTETIRMTLDHDTGEMDGTVIKGPFAGRTLSAMSFPDLAMLHHDCRTSDPNAAQLLEAYLDRVHKDAWRAHQDGRDEGASQSGSKQARAPGGMDIEEAYATLGLSPGASKDEIKAAHHRLMKRLHPDQGGSTFLASKINQAKDVLLKTL